MQVIKTKSDSALIYKKCMFWSLYYTMSSLHVNLRMTETTSRVTYFILRFGMVRHINHTKPKKKEEMKLSELGRQELAWQNSWQQISSRKTIVWSSRWVELPSEVFWLEFGLKESSPIDWFWFSAEETWISAPAVCLPHCGHRLEKWRQDQKNRENGSFVEESVCTLIVNA